MTEIKLPGDRRPTVAADAVDDVDELARSRR